MFKRTELDKMAYRGGAKDIHWDTELRGFGVRVYPTGRKVFVLRLQRDGKDRLITIGPLGVFTAHTAHARACELLGKVYRGEDPAPKAAKDDALTWAEYAELWMRRHGEKTRSVKACRNRIDNRIVPNWGRLKLAEMTTESLARWHAAYSEKSPYEANGVLTLISAMWERAKQWGLLPRDGPSYRANPVQGIPRNPDVKRLRYVSEIEMPYLIAAIDADRSAKVRAAIWLYMLTGMRKANILGLTWDRVDLTRGTVFVERTKSGEPLLMPIPEHAVEILKELPRQIGNTHVFASGKAGRHLEDLRVQWERVKKRTIALAAIAGVTIDVSDLHIHDLRHTVASWMAMSGESMLTISKVLTHKSIVMTQRYAHLDSKTLRDAVDRHAARVLSFKR